MKRCKDCKWSKLVENGRANIWYKCLRHYGNPATNYNKPDKDCLLYSRKWWKFWRPK